jgi:hypothetical protein
MESKFDDNNVEVSEGNFLNLQTNKLKLLKFYKLLENIILEREQLFNDSELFRENLKSNLEKYKDDSILDNLFNEEGYLISKNFVFNNNKFIFRSYPVKNYLLHFCHNLIMCKEVGRFIFEFIYLEGFNNKTEEQVENLDQIIKSDTNLDNVFKIIFSNQIENNLVLLNELKDRMSEFSKRIGARGFMTMMGLRHTPGSITCLPPDIDSLIKGFKDLNTKNTYEKNKNKKPSVLTVGARALCKHSHRSTEVLYY